MAIVSWDGCTLTDPRTEQLAQGLEATQLFQQVMSGPRILRQLTTSGSLTSTRTALSRLQGTLIGPDGQITCLALVMSEQATRDRSATVAMIHEVAKSLCQLEAHQLHLAGPTVDAAAINAESKRMLFQLAGLAGLLSFVVAAYRMDSTKLAVIVFAVSLYCVLAALSIVYFSGGRMNLLMTMYPPLIFILATSAAVHLVNYYKDALRHPDIESPAEEAARRGLYPCWIAALTTAIGLASLASSKIDSIRAFGYFSSAGVLLSLFIIFLMLPVCLTLFCLHVPRHPVSNHRSRWSWAPLKSFWVMVVLNRYVSVIVVCAVLMLLGTVGLFSLDSTVRLQARFLPESKILQDYRWLEDHIGPMVPMEIVIAFPQKTEHESYEQFLLLNKIQAGLKAMPVRLSTLSASDFVAPIPTGAGVGDVIKRRVINRKLVDAYPRLIDSHYLAQAETQWLWRISVRAEAMQNLDYGILMGQIRDVVDPLLSEKQVKASYTGIIPLIYKAQRQLLQDLVISFLTAFIIVAVVMAFVLRSITAALLAMIPNVFPVILVFGLLGWLEISLQIGSVMTASVALGIAVDDTIHFVTWFNRGVGNGLTRPQALQESIDHCAGAMIHTTVISCAGLIVFTASTFVPILHFAYLMVLLLTIALLGDLILLPSILASPLGRYFKRS
jgi:hypothetical protein